MIILISGSRRLHGSDRAGAEPPRRGGGRAHQDRLCGLVVRILMMIMDDDDHHGDIDEQCFDGDDGIDDGGDVDQLIKVSCAEWN